MAKEPTWTLGVDPIYIEVIAMQAKLEKIKVTNAAMHAANSARAKLGAALAYGEDHFQKLAEDAGKLIDRLTEMSIAVKLKLAEEEKAESMEVDKGREDGGDQGSPEVRDVPVAGQGEAPAEERGIL